MSPSIITLIVCSVSLSAFAQLTLRYGMTDRAVQFALQYPENRLQIAWAISTNKYVISGLIMYALGAIFWLFVLSKIEVSIAYPFMGIGFIITMLLAILFLGETASVTRIVGTVLVSIGVVLVSQS